MSIASEITRIQGNISDSYTAISNKGGTLPATQNSDNLATAIGTIPSGSGPKHYIQRNTDVNGKLVTSGSLATLDLSGVIDLDDYSLSYAFYNCGDYTGNAFNNANSLVSISGSYALQYAFSGDSSYGGTSTKITDTCLENVETISGTFALYYAYYNCQYLDTIGLDKLKTISGNNALRWSFTSSSIKSANFPCLETISANYVFDSAFKNCSKLTEIRFTKLSSISGPLGYNSSRCVAGNSVLLENVYFNALKSTSFGSLNVFQYLFDSNTGSQATNGCTVHFPSNFDPADPDHTFDASTLTGYPTFGGNASYIHVAFDLPATE